jgi:hypothetical protein
LRLRLLLLLPWLLLLLSMLLGLCLLGLLRASCLLVVVGVCCEQGRGCRGMDRTRHCLGCCCWAADRVTPTDSKGSSSSTSCRPGG